MKKIFAFLVLFLITVMAFAQENCEKKFHPLDPYQYIISQMDTDGLYFYMKTPEGMVLDVECLSFDVNEEVHSETFKDVDEIMFSYLRPVLLSLNTGNTTTKVVSYIDWDIPNNDKPESTLSTVFLVNHFPIRFALRYKAPKHPDSFRKN